ncbi:MAG: winged helix-turn-helix domain-containing protein [Alphaproteobacteria bacterium]|nr:winged helix-turn-helix domain-containing protein [Alphaproteobacteria bacterium]
MQSVLVLSNNNVFKEDLISQIRYHAPEFTVCEEYDTAVDVVVADEIATLPDEIITGRKAPLILLSTKDVIGEARASQVIFKPMVLESFLDALRAANSVFENSDDGCLEFGEYILYPARREIVNIESEKLCKLTEKEVAVVKYLYKNANDYVSKQDLLKEVWGYADDATTHTVETHIYRLRQKVEEQGAAGLIETSEGGYRLKKDC